MVFSPEVQKEINELLVMVISGISAGLLIVVPIVGKMAWTLVKAWFNSKIALIQNQEVREALMLEMQKIDFALARIDKTSETVVEELNQTGVVQRDPTTKKVTNSDKVKATAIDRVFKRLPAIAQESLQKEYGKFEMVASNPLLRLIQGKIESKIKVIPRC